MKSFDEQQREREAGLATAQRPTLERIRRAIARAESHQVRTLLGYLEGHLFDPTLHPGNWPLRSRLSGDCAAVFESEVGVSLSDYLWDCRLEASALLLAGTDWSVREIAENVGYSGRRAYQRAFRAWSGLEPQELRDRVRQKPPASTKSGRDMLSSELLQELVSGCLDRAEVIEVFDRMQAFYLSRVAVAVPVPSLERQLAQQLWEEHLSDGRASPALVETCRLLFTTQVFDDLLEREGVLG